MISQTCAFFDYRMGDTGYVTESGLARQFHTPARALYGEVMIPVCDLSHPDSQPQGSWYQDDWHGAWDADIQYVDPSSILSCSDFCWKLTNPYVLYAEKMPPGAALIKGPPQVVW